MPSAVDAMRSAAVALTCKSPCIDATLFGRQHVEAHQVDFSPNLSRQVGQVDARLLGEADRQFLYRADGLEHVAARPGLIGKAAHRRFADECDVAKRCSASHGSMNLRSNSAAASGDTAIEPPISRICSTSRRETSTASGWNAPKAPAPAPSRKS